MTTGPRLVEVRQNVLKRNDLLARALRERFQKAGVCVISLVSSPGSGKTMFLEKILSLLGERYAVAALVGDLATENDAARLARSHLPVQLAFDRLPLWLRAFLAAQLAMMAGLVFPLNSYYFQQLPISSPLGNLIARYPADVEQRRLLEDLERLLGLSRVG